jgi:L-cysteine S-thiosulfotransferase
VLAACTSSPSSADYDKLTADVVKASFQDRGIAKLDRLEQDDANRECSAADVAGKPLDEKGGQGHRSGQHEDHQVAFGRQVPGRLERGRENCPERSWPDLERQGHAANGGNCYNCHQISKEEISFGTLGPSLYNYGKLRGVTDPNAAASKAIVEYTWGKLWNSRAYNACSQMPRAGHARAS